MDSPVAASQPTAVQFAHASLACANPDSAIIITLRLALRMAAHHDTCASVVAVFLSDLKLPCVCHLTQHMWSMQVCDV